MRRNQVNEQRDDFRVNVKMSLKSSVHTQRSLAHDIGITPQEFSNLINGYQLSVPSKGIDTFEDFIEKVKRLLGEEYKDYSA